MTMTIDTPAVSAEPVPQSPRLRIGLIVLSALLFIGALTSLPAIFADYGHTDRLMVFAQRLGSVKLALAPGIAGAALLFAIRSKLPHAIVALATLMLVTWLAELPSIAIHGLELNHGDFFYASVIAARYLLYPLLAVAAMALALRKQRLVTAAVLTAIPVIEQWLGVAIFGIGIAIYGF